MRKRFHEKCSFEVVLDHPESLFNAPEVKPFNNQFECDSGFDRLVLKLKATEINTDDQLHLILKLPQLYYTETININIKHALDMFCDKQEERSKLKIASARKSGMISFKWGILFLIMCLIVSGSAEKFLGSHPLTQSVIAESFLIAGWVLMWRPIELLFFVTKNLNRESRLYPMIKRMSLEMRFYGNDEKLNV